MKNKIAYLVLSLLFISSFGISCASINSLNVFSDDTFYLISIVDQNNNFNKEDQALLKKITINLNKTKRNEYQISGCSGINRYFGQIKLKKNEFLATNFASTQMAGPAKMMELEYKYLNILANGGIIKMSNKNDKKYLTIKNIKHKSKIVFVSK